MTLEVGARAYSGFSFWEEGRRYRQSFKNLSKIRFVSTFVTFIPTGQKFQGGGANPDPLLNTMSLSEELVSLSLKPVSFVIISFSLFSHLKNSKELNLIQKKDDILVYTTTETNPNHTSILLISLGKRA